MAYDKDYLREIMALQKQETLEKNVKVIDQFRDDYEENAKKDCNLMTDHISIDVCETQKEKRRWYRSTHGPTNYHNLNSFFFVSISSSKLSTLPYRFNLVITLLRSHDFL